MSTVIDGSASVTINSGVILGITSGTAVASTSGTSIDFTGIPSWVKRITVMFSGVSFNANALPMIQIGAGSVSTTGYSSAAGDYVPTANFTNSSAGFILAAIVTSIGVAANNIYGQIVITNVTGNLWCYASNLSAFGSSSNTATGAGTITLGGTLDRVRITSLAGTSTFDAGSVNIMYEG